MIQAVVSDDACEFIIENTITECNRVLHNWKLNKKPIGYNDKLSLFRSYFAEFFKQRFGYGAYHKYIRVYCPLVVIDNYRVVSIDLNITKYNDRPNVYLASLDRFLKRFDVMKFSELQEFKEIIVDENTKVSNLVDYKKLCNIRFN
jgi:hypothetical protein